MPRNISAANLLALQQGLLVFRDFVSITARVMGSSETVRDDMWSDYGNVSAQIINPNTGATESRDFYGSGTIISIDDIPMTSNLQAQNVNINMGQINAHVENLLRGYDLRQAPIEIYRGFFDPSSRLMVAPAEARFVGFIDSVEIDTPAENEFGNAIATCVSNTQEITRANSETRSQASQAVRVSNDGFFNDSATTGSWKVWWGSVKGKVS